MSAPQRNSKKLARQQAAEATSAPETTPHGKGHPTPKRSQAQAQNARPIVGNRDKAQRKAQRQAELDERNRARLGMMAGEERYLTPRDKGPQRRYTRDFVDARYNVGEYMIPVMFGYLFLSLISQPLQQYGIFVVWAFIALAILDGFLLTMQLRRKLCAKFGAEHLQPGFRFYAIMRALQFRMLRAPKPQVKRRQYPH